MVMKIDGEYGYDVVVNFVDGVLLSYLFIQGRPLVVNLCNALGRISPCLKTGMQRTVKRELKERVIIVSPCLMP